MADDEKTIEVCKNCGYQIFWNGEEMGFEHVINDACHNPRPKEEIKQEVMKEILKVLKHIRTMDTNDLLSLFEDVIDSTLKKSHKNCVAKDDLRKILDSSANCRCKEFGEDVCYCCRTKLEKILEGDKKRS